MYEISYGGTRSTVA